MNIFQKVLQRILFLRKRHGLFVARMLEKTLPIATLYSEHHVSLFGIYTLHI